ncbi:MAG: thioredoxin family protein [Alphaproteobacteria bacterium]|nr:thioredoxin family protein [Alphaproteobacteria bacterium]
MALTTTPVCAFGTRAPDFDLPATDGQRYRLADIRGARGTLVMFLCNHCPYVRAIVDRLVDHVGTLMDEGIGAIAIMPNDTLAYPEDGFDAMAAFAARHRFPFPYVIDESQAVARAYGAVCTPDFFGYDAADGLQYRGRLDASRTTLLGDARPDLLLAMRAIAGTGKGPAEQIPSMGCSIKWRED